MKNWKSYLPFGLAGAAAGLINGFFGAGGGMVLVPLLIHLGKLPDKEAFASKGRNTPFHGFQLKGKVKYTISMGQIIYQED